MSSTKDEDQTNDSELSVTFYPPLYLQRRAWVFRAMRQEHITRVLDVGCGEGELVACLCNPAPWLSSPAPRPPNTPTHSPETESKNQTRDAEYLHVTSIHALDVCPSAVQCAVAATTPRPSTPPGAIWAGPPRWEALDAHVWHGALERVNPAFVDVECIVATEVIEHLPPHVLPQFAPVLLGTYHPRLLLLTTPSYTFNARFTPPDAPPSTRNGYPDPTGRTDRVFRHSDHKFEWTVDEFTEWCCAAADDWGYDVEIGGVGKPLEKDKWGRDEQLGWASQVAAFRRREGEGCVAARAERCAQVRADEGAVEREEGTAHRLMATHRHAAHECAGKPRTLREIGELVKEMMERFQENAMTVQELWNERDVGARCGGWVELLVDAVERHDKLRLQKVPPGWANRLEWGVELVEPIPERPSLWPPNAEHEAENVRAIAEASSESGEGTTWQWSSSSEDTWPERSDTEWEPSKSGWGTLEDQHVASGWGAS